MKGSARRYHEIIDTLNPTPGIKLGAEATSLRAPNTGHSTPHYVGSQFGWRHWVPGNSHLLLVAGVALVARLLFAVLTARTYDYDEFVILLLSRDYAHGAVPYRDFMFFHPPGIMILFQWLEPLTSLWWPFARILTLLVDAGTAVLVAVAAGSIWSRREALFAGLLYAFSPLAVLSAVRVDQDAYLTFLGMLGLVFLLRSDARWSVLSGLCLALAVSMKYPAALFAVPYFLVAPRRTLLWLPAAVISAILIVLPFVPEGSQLYWQTITFQKSRWLMAPGQRIETVILYWLLINLAALPGLLGRAPLWAKTGFLVGLVFVASSQVYYHYFVPMVPFAALLAAPLVARLLPDARRMLAIGAAVLVGCAAVIDLGGSSPLYITAARFNDIAPTIRLLDKTTRSGQPVLADRYEYAYLAHRPALAHYFWNVGVLVGEGYLERRLPAKGAVVLSFGASSGFPAGFTSFLDAHYRSVRTRANTVWVIKSRHSSVNRS